MVKLKTNIVVATVTDKTLQILSAKSLVSLVLVVQLEYMRLEPVTLVFE
jgi:hypothetical protein